MTINLGAVGMDEHQNFINDQIRIVKGSSNPFFGNTEICLLMPSKGPLNATVNDLRGRNYLNQNLTLEKGIHHFQFTAGNQSLYILTFTSGSNSVNIKLIPLESSNQQVNLESMETGGLMLVRI